MSNLSTKILMISLLIRISNGLDCHKCNKGHSTFIPPDHYEKIILKKEIERIELVVQTGSKDIKNECKANGDQPSPVQWGFLKILQFLIVSVS